MLIATDVRRIEVETGYGAEAVLPDGRVGRVLDEFVVPSLREGNWDGAILGAAREFARILSTSETPAQVTGRARLARVVKVLWGVVAASVLVLLGILVSIPVRFWRTCPQVSAAHGVG